MTKHQPVISWNIFIVWNIIIVHVCITCGKCLTNFPSSTSHCMQRKKENCHVHEHVQLTCTLFFVLSP